MTCLLDWETPSAGRIHFGSLARAFAAEGHEVIGVIPARRDRARDPAPFARVYATPRFNEGYAGQLLRAAAHLGVLARAIRRERPDAIYVRFRSCSPLSCAAARLCARGAVVVGEHNTWASAYLEVSGYSTAVNALSRRNQLLAARSAHRIRTSTRHLKNILVEQGIEAGRVFVAGMGADLDRFRPLPRDESLARAGLDPSARYVGYAGSLNRWQGVDVLIESLRHLPGDVRVVILGEGPQADNLRRQAAQAGLSDRVLFKGHVPHEDMPWWINCFEVGVGALRTQARGRMLGTPMKLAEYAACGAPAVAASVEGVEILEQRAAVIRVPSEDARAAAEAIRRLLREPAERRSMGLAARAVAEECLSWTAIARQVLAHFLPIPAGPDRRSASDLRRLAGAGLPAGRAFTYLYRRHGIYLPRAARSVWVVGERPADFEAAGPLIRRLRELQPKHRLVVLSPDPGTFDWLCARYAGDTALPFPRDTRRAVDRFVAALAPRLVIRLGRDSVPGARWAAPLAGAGTPVVTVRAGGADPDAGALIREDLSFEVGLGLPVPAGAYLRRELGLSEEAPVILAEQVCPGEESILLAAWCRVREARPDAVLLLEPRRRGQTGSILRLARRYGLAARRRSQPVRAETPAVLVLDRAAELPALYAVASVAVLGGSFTAGGPVANPVCPARFGVPVVTGPGSRDGVEKFVREGAAIRMPSANLAESLLTLLGDPARRKALAESAGRLVAANEGATMRAWSALAPFLPSGPREPDTQGWRVKTRVDRLSDTAFGQWLAGRRSGRRLDTWEELRERLGRPRAILCLGNGPSSEDPAIRDICHDCLMRINWRWKGRGLLDRPDLVMVGHPRTLQEAPPCVFGFGRVEWERAMLIRHLLMGGLRPVEFFTLERVASILRPTDWHARPTNGALLVAIAAALQPDELILAGYDLFRHPDGRYPGDVHSQNEPAQVHDRDADVEVIARALAAYTGRVDIRSDILRAALDARPA